MNIFINERKTVAYRYMQITRCTTALKEGALQGNSSKGGFVDAGNEGSYYKT